MEVKTKEIHKLLPNFHGREFFLQVSLGLENILSNANSIMEDARLLSKHDRICGHNILFGIAEEEAGKFLLLVDAVRCPRGKLSGHLKRFNSHIPKGIYAISSYLDFIDFVELKEAVNGYLRQNTFISFEPEGAWISKNPITTVRELSIYVDYIVTCKGEQRWINPSKNKSMPPVSIPESLELANAFYASGLTKPEALEIIAEIWNPVEMTDDFRRGTIIELNKETLKRLDAKNLLINQEEPIYKLIVDSWSFPMHSIELESIQTKSSDLKGELDEINNSSIDGGVFS